VLPLLRCQMKTIALSKHARRCCDGLGLVTAWQEIQAHAEQLLRERAHHGMPPADFVVSAVRQA
jgi:hypothetical protein